MNSLKVLALVWSIMRQRLFVKLVIVEVVLISPEWLIFVFMLVLFWTIMINTEPSFIIIVENVFMNDSDRDLMRVKILILFIIRIVFCLLYNRMIILIFIFLFCPRRFFLLLHRSVIQIFRLILLFILIFHLCLLWSGGLLKFAFFRFPRIYDIDSNWAHVATNEWHAAFLVFVVVTSDKNSTAATEAVSVMLAGHSITAVNCSKYIAWQLSSLRSSLRLVFCLRLVRVFYLLLVFNSRGCWFFLIL